MAITVDLNDNKKVDEFKQASKHKSEDDKTVALEDHVVWFRTEFDVLKEKNSNAATKARNAKDKLDELCALEEDEKMKKCRRQVRSALKAPMRILLKLKDIGDDINDAIAEGLKRYRVERLLDTYEKKYFQLDKAIKRKDMVLDHYAKTADDCGGFPEESMFENLALKDPEGAFIIETSEGNFSLTLNEIKR